MRETPGRRRRSRRGIIPPDLTFAETLHLHFAGRSIDLHWLGRAHTSGDIFVHLPEERLVFTGDVAQDGGRAVHA